jgi:(2Fe-2S) ferredoxin
MTTSGRQVLICQSRTCKKDGAALVLATFQQAAIANVEITQSGCMGLCGSGPMVLVLPDLLYYWQVTPAKAHKIIEGHLLKNAPITTILHPRMHPNS